MGIANLNGGDTVITEQNPSLTAVSPSGIPIGEYFQAYAPVQNENLYTHNWTGPFYGYRRVIESFRLTDAPRRLKPMGIYYHFYSGGKHASLKALETVYQWALQQQPFPLWLSEYVDKVQDFREIMIARGLDDGWRIYSRGAARTLRLDPKLGWPDLKRSEGIIGVRELPQGRYVSLDGRPKTNACFHFGHHLRWPASSAPGSTPYFPRNPWNIVSPRWHQTRLRSPICERWPICER